MGFGDSFKKKVGDAAKAAVDKAVEKAVPPRPAAKPASSPPAKAAAPAPARPAQNKPFPGKPTPARPGASAGPMFDHDEKTVLDKTLQAKMRQQLEEEEQEKALDDVLDESSDDAEVDRTANQKPAYGASAYGDESDEPAEDEEAEESDDEEMDEEESDDEQEESEDEGEGGVDDGDEDGEDGVAYHQAAGGELEFPVPVGWGVSDLTNEEFWVKVFDLEDAQMKGDAAFKKALKKYHLDSAEHFSWIRERFTARHAEDADFQQAMMNARMAQSRAMMSNAAAGTDLLSPIDGVSLETYATLQARRGKLPQQTVAAFGKLLAEYGLDAAKWARVDKAWLARMSDSTDPMATMAVNTEYAKYFAAAGQGQFGAGAKAGSKQLGLKDPVGKAPKGGEPCTFERYVEIMTAQSCWATQGKDVNAMLKKVFKMDAMDYSALASYWSPKMMSDIRLMTEVMPKLQEKYTKRYSAPAQDDDLDI